MKAKDIKRFNDKIDEVQRMMHQKGYDQKKLVATFFSFLFLALDDEKEKFQLVISKLIRMNEKVENYEICNHLQTIQQELNETEMVLELQD